MELGSSAERKCLLQCADSARRAKSALEIGPFLHSPLAEPLGSGLRWPASHRFRRAQKLLVLLARLTPQQARANTRTAARSGARPRSHAAGSSGLLGGDSRGRSAGRLRLQYQGPLAPRVRIGWIDTEAMIYRRQGLAQEVRDRLPLRARQTRSHAI